MSQSVYRLCFRWLKSLKIPVSSAYLKGRLLSHPDYPSLLSITDVLDEIGIENAALVVDREKVNDIPVPFLVHLNINRMGQFVLIKNLKNALRKYADFYSNWNGIVIVAARPKIWRNRDNEKFLLARKSKKYIFMVMFGVFLSLIVSGLLINYSWLNLSLTLISILGFFISVLIVQQEFGFGNQLTEKLCSTTEKSDCNAVMKSKAAKILKWFDWTDASVIYFYAVSITVLIRLLSGSSTTGTPLPLLAGIVMPITFFSIYYQWKIVNKWCPLCLIMVIILWSQFALQLPDLAAFKLTAIPPTEILIILLLFIIGSGIWLLLLKPLLRKTKEMEEINISLQRFKNNTSVVASLLEQQRRIDMSPFINDLQLGNPEAKVQLLVACNPYCVPCAKTHEVLEEVLTRNDIGLTIRFAINSLDTDSIKAVKHIFQHLKGHSSPTILYTRRVLLDWYKWVNYEKFAKIYYADRGVNVDDQVEFHKHWALEFQIQYTPTIFVNGFELPKQYKINDIIGIIKGLAAGKAKADVQSSNANYTPV